MPTELSEPGYVEAERYAFSLTTFSASGRLKQLKYASAAITVGDTSVGVLATNGVVIAMENQKESRLCDAQSVHQLETIDKHLGMAYSGFGPDFRPLVFNARKLAQTFRLAFKEPIPVEVLVERMSLMMQEFTQTGGVRPFGVGLLVCGWDYGRPYLYRLNPAGNSSAWTATGMGKHGAEAQAYLRQHSRKSMNLCEAVGIAILALRAGFEGQMTANNIEVGVCDAKGFKLLTVPQIREILMRL
ncbi:hypothetical protein KR018_003872 [Drosophila ironensis]|nr:hypothetical protein KR018_003872 [Drosophila ironensis]